MYYKKNLDIVALIWEDLPNQIDNIDSKKQDKMFYPRFTKIIIHHFLEKDKSISLRNRTFMHTAHDDSLLGTMIFVSRHVDTQVYGEILFEAMTNQALLDSVAYKTYFAIASGAEPPKSRKSQKKSDSVISSKESPSKKKSAKAKKVVATKPKPNKKKAPSMADSGKGTDEGTSTKPRVLDVPKYDFESKKESWSDSGEKDNDDENDSKDDSDGNVDNNNDDDDGNDGNDGNETDSDRTESDRIKIPILNQSTTEYYEDEEEKIDDEENMDEEENDEVLDTQKTDEPVQSSFISSDFISKLLNLENLSQADNEIASLMDTTAHHKEPRSQTLSLYTIPIMETPKVTSTFTTTIPLPPHFFNPLPQQATPTLTPTTSEATTSFPSLPDFLFVFKSQDDRDKDQDPSVGSDRGTKRRKSSNEAESSRDSRSKEKKSSRTSKDAFHSQHKPSGKSAHAEYPSHTVDDSGVQQHQEFDAHNNDEQPADKEVSKDGWFKKLERPLALNHD
nr:hypothetical protein [Tanacetum cinerariifolium]